MKPKKNFFNTKNHFQRISNSEESDFFPPQERNNPKYVNCLNSFSFSFINAF